MCGRFTQRMTWRELHNLLDLTEPARSLRPRYNIAPGQEAAVIRTEDGAPRLAMLRWGLIPGWARDPGIGSRTINARAETAAVKPAFRAAWRSRRCLVPADGFYEWSGRRDARLPWFIRMKDDEPFALAGLWERWTAPEGLTFTGALADLSSGDAVETFTVLTTEANDAVAPVHHRMPVILPPELFGPWLAGDDVPLGPCPPERLALHRVSARVNRPGNDDPGCVAPAKGEPETLSLFPEEH